MSGGSGGGATAVASVALTTKGDLLTFNTAETRLPVGLVDGQVLTVNAAVADGIEWSTSTHKPTQSFITACSDETSDLATGILSYWRTPYAFTVTGVRASVTTAPTGANITVDILQNGVSILTTNITIDVTEKTSQTAAIPPVILTSALTDDSEITINLTTIGSTIAGTGLKVTIIGNQT
jgi:hypothetical protein